MSISEVSAQNGTIASLLDAKRSELKRTLGHSAFTIEEADDAHCRVITDGITIHLYGRPAEGLIHSSIELRSVPTHTLHFTDHLHTWLLLKSCGEEWPETGEGNPPSDQLRHELQRLGRAIPIVRDDMALRETLFWEAGYMHGYASWD